MEQDHLRAVDLTHKLFLSYVKESDSHLASPHLWIDCVCLKNSVESSVCPKPLVTPAVTLNRESCAIGCPPRSSAVSWKFTSLVFSSIPLMCKFPVGNCLPKTFLFKFLIKIFYLYFICFFVCMCCVCICAHTWRLDINIVYLSRSFSSMCFEIESLTEPRVYWMARLVGRLALGKSTSMPPLPLCC